jgi:hypothetical protein
MATRARRFDTRKTFACQAEWFRLASKIATEQPSGESLDCRLDDIRSEESERRRHPDRTLSLALLRSYRLQSQTWVGEKFAQDWVLGRPAIREFQTPPEVVRLHTSLQSALRPRAIVDAVDVLEALAVSRGGCTDRNTSTPVR